MQSEPGNIRKMEQILNDAEQNPEVGAIITQEQATEASVPEKI